MASSASAMARVMRASLIFFFLSGTSGLIYQVLWTRRLTLIFGHTVLAVSTVLTAFMAGLALGSLGGGRFCDRVADRPPLVFLRYYGMLELAIGGWAVLSLGLFELVELAYVEAASSGLEGLSLYLLCFTGALLVLLPPTTAMGATVPVMSRLWVRHRDDLGRLLSRLYGVNTMGAVSGALLAGFVLLPALGARASMLIAALLNLFIGVLAIRGARGSKNAANLQAGPTEQRAGARGLVLVCFTLAGFGSMTFQVAWTRALTLSIGSSTYSFSTILVVFLGGLGLGSLLYAKLFARHTPSLWGFALILFVIGLSGGVLIPALGALPRAFVFLFPYTGESLSGVLLLNFLLAGLLLLGPTLAMGVAFPYVTELCTRSLSELGRSVGGVYSANTLGCIVGAFTSGFLLIPQIGTELTLRMTSGIYLLASLALFLSGSRRWLWPIAGVTTCMVGLLLLPGWRSGVLASGTAIYAADYSGHSSKELARTLFRPPTYYRDGLSCTVSGSFSGPFSEVFSLRVNGKVDASTLATDVRNMRLTGYLPALYHKAPRSAALIGLGGGFTLEALTQVPGMEEIVCLELEPSVVDAAGYFKAYNGDALEDSRVQVKVTDGRTFLLGTPARFDLIVSEPSNPWIAGIGNLFTVDFYSSCSQRLNPGGVMCQWLNLYAVSKQDILMVLASFYEVFPEGSVWLAGGGDLLMLGSLDTLQFEPARVAEFFTKPTVARHLFEAEIYKPEMFAGLYLMNRESALRAAQGVPLNTDDRPLLEFRAPFSLYRGDGAENRSFVTSLGEGPLPEGLEVSEQSIVQAAFGWLAASKHRQLAESFKERPPAGEWGDLLAAELLRDQASGQADALFAKALESTPEPGLAYFLWAQRARDMGRSEEAVSLYQRALQSPPPGGRWQVLINLGLEQMKLAKPMLALISFQEATRLRTRDFRGHTYMGHAFAQLGNHEQALKSFQEALNLNPNSAFAHFGVAVAEFNLGRYRSADKSLVRAIRLVPDDPVYWKYRGLLRLALKDKRAAEQALRRALELEPEDAGSAEALSKLAED